MNLLFQYAENGEVFESYGGEVGLITYCESCSCCIGLVTSMQRAIRYAFPRRRIHIVGMLLSIWPIAHKLAVVFQRSLSAIMGQFDSEGAASGDFEEGILGRRGIVAAAVVLEPPVGFGEVVERVDGEVIVAVGGGGGVAEGAVHAFCCPCCCMGGCAGCEGSGDEGGFEHFYVASLAGG